MTLAGTTLGDRDFDHVFDSTDLVAVSQAGRYELAAGGAQGD